MKQVFLPENNYTGFVEAFEIEEYHIDVCLTIFKGYRVKIREVGNQYYLADWCAGQDVNHKNLLLKVAEYCIINDVKYPAYNEHKPFFNDLKFIKWMQEHGFEI